LGLSLLMGGCAAMPAVAPRAAAPVQAQWGGQDTQKLVRQLVLATFDRADRNHDRFLDVSEYDRIVIAAADLDRDGRVTTLEWAERHPVDALTAAWQASARDYFARLDTDRDGWVNRTEAKGLAIVPGFGVPKDLYFDRYAGMNAGLSPRVFTDFMLQVAYDAGRFKPFVVAPPFPVAMPGEKPPAGPLPMAPALAAASKARK
jgi:hypothetical protein